MIKVYITLLLTVLMLFLNRQCLSQHISLKSLLSSDTSMFEHNHFDKYKNVTDTHDNEYELALNVLFVFYKDFISSQDGDNCNFTPSCSEYAAVAIKEKGVIKGAAMFFDRFARCNSLNREFYEVDVEKKRLIDPVR